MADMTTTNQRAVELAPCPFCGDAAKLSARPASNADGGGFIAFAVCYCGGFSATAHQTGKGTTEADAKRDATFAWNRRTPGWRPISEAPRDGSQFLGWFEGSTVQIWWMGQGGLWGNDFWEGKEPTHFMPLPPPPGE
jgi:hypothetical protein